MFKAALHRSSTTRDGTVSRLMNGDRVIRTGLRHPGIVQVLTNELVDGYRRICSELSFVMRLEVFKNT